MVEQSGRLLGLDFDGRDERGQQFGAVGAFAGCGGRADQDVQPAVDLVAGESREGVVYDTLDADCSAWRRGLEDLRVSVGTAPGAAGLNRAGTGRMFRELCQYAPNDQKTPTSSSFTATTPKSSNMSRPAMYSRVWKQWEAVPWSPSVRKFGVGSQAAAVALVQ